jgi:hypothetical protein
VSYKKVISQARVGFFIILSKKLAPVFTSSISESNIMSIAHHNRFVTDAEMEG